jgi:hypothetical protein
VETKAVKITEVETPLEETWSLNHFRLTYRICVLLAAYEAQYDILPELELSSGRAKPDVSVYRNLTFDWEEDVVRYTIPPLTAIEMLSHAGFRRTGYQNPQSLFSRRHAVGVAGGAHGQSDSSLRARAARANLYAGRLHRPGHGRSTTPGRRFPVATSVKHCNFNG